MDHNHRVTKKPHSSDTFGIAKTNFQIWGPLFQRLGLKPRRFFTDPEAVYIGASEGWFRLGLRKYSKQELNWLRNTLKYLEDRSFKNWAAPWQKSLIWEEKAFCYLIQPWRVGGEVFRADDPASITRVAEILTFFYECGKGYVLANQMEISRNLWRNLEAGWETAIQKLENIKIEDFHEKIRNEVNDLRKEALAGFNDMVKSWRSSGIHSLFEAHHQIGMLGHGNLLAKYLNWWESDYYLLNWEYLAFQPRIRDLASLINDIAVWDPEWIIFLITACARIQPFWPEEYQALMVLLKEPAGVINLLENVKHTEFDRKNLKEVIKSLNKKSRCLEKVWYELGAEKRWPASPAYYHPSYHSRELSMVLTPVETWGGFSGSSGSLIKLSGEQPNLPREIMERLSLGNPEKSENRGIVGGANGNILGDSQVGPERFTEPGSNTTVDGPDKPVVSGFPAEVIEESETLETTTIPEACSGDIKPKSVIAGEQPPSVQNPGPGTRAQQPPETLRWAGFPEKSFKGES
ncbi:MAG: hypothetical protein K6U80_00390 [Firmicutes bacterium]|nr:hypothetical protein [Bacillota bacterium]